MGRVIGRNDIDPIFNHRSKKSFLVLTPFNGRVAFDVCASRRVPTVVTKKMVNTSFSRNSLSFDWTGVEQFHFAGGRQMEYVETRAVCVRQLDRERRRCVTHFSRADVRMFNERDIVAELFSCAGFIRQNHGCVFAMSGNEYRCRGENPIKRFGVVNQHITGRRPHEDLDAAGAGWIDRFNVLKVVVGRAKIKAVVRERVLCRPIVFTLQCFGIRGLGIAVWHLHVTGDAASDRST